MKGQADKGKSPEGPAPSPSPSLKSQTRPEAKIPSWCKPLYKIIDTCAEVTAYVFKK